MNSTYQLNELSGSLWPEQNCTVIKKGKIKIFGEDRYASIIKYVNPNGEEKYELSISAGLLRLNPEENKLSNSSPDIYGSITFNDQAFKFGAYENISDKGTEWTKVLLQEKKDEENREKKAPF